MWGIINITQYHSPWIVSTCLQALTQYTQSVFDFYPPNEGTLVSIQSGIPCPKFIKWYGLSLNLSPKEWFRSFCTNSQGRNKKGGFCTNEWATYTNFKAVLSNSSTGAGYTYPTFTSSTTCDIKRHHGLYILQGLSQFPRVYMKFNTQNIDPQNGNDTVASIFGPGSQTWFINFKDF